MDEEYIAQLKKQLEELKRKKARKERKLQKLKCSSRDLKRESSTKTSHASKEPEQENESSLKKLEKNVLEEKKYEKKCSVLINSLCREKSLDTHFENDKEVPVNKKCDSLNFENHKFNKSIKNLPNANEKASIIAVDEQCIQNFHTDKTSTNYLKKFNYPNNSVIYEKCEFSENNIFLKPTVSEIKTNFENSNDHKLSHINDKLSSNVEKSPIVPGNETNESVKHNFTTIDDKEPHIDEKTLPSVVEDEIIVLHDKETSDDKAEKVKQINKSDDLVLINAPDITKNCSKDNSSKNENKLSNDSNKSLPSSKGKSSDILDDSLNCNMSFFMSADLFNEDDGKKDHNDNKLCEKIDECNLPIEEDSRISKLPQPDNMHLSINAYQQNTVDVFNFPKFSTPTEGNTQIEKDDDMPDLIEKSPEISNSIKRNNSLNKGFRNVLPSTSKCDSPLLNFVLEKRLSSVLDAHYESPKKTNSKIKIDDNVGCSNNKEVCTGNAYKKRKLFSKPSSIISSENELESNKVIPSADLNKKSDIAILKSFGASVEVDQEIKYDDFDNVSAFDSDSNSFNSLKDISEPPVMLIKNSCDVIPSQVSKTVDSLVNEICDNTSKCKLLLADSMCKNEEKFTKMDEESKVDSEVLIIPETEGLGLLLEKEVEEFLETSTLSESIRDFPVKDNILNVSSQSKLESPVVNNIVAAIKSSRSSHDVHQEDKLKVDAKLDNKLERTPEKVDEKIPSDATLAFGDSLGLDTSFLEDDTQDLGNFKQVPYMNDVNVDERPMTDETKADTESTLKFVCSLSSSIYEPVVNVEIILFNNVKYAVLQHRRHICVWRQEKKKQWVSIFCHQIEDMLVLVKISVSMDDDNLIIIMLLRNEEQFCLQFLIFEKEARVIKLMENSHWLEERCSEESILLCGLSNLMFAIAQNRRNSEISIHAFISLKENPRLMTAVLGSTDSPLCSLCKIDKLPNALMGINDSMLYVWHVLEARLVTAVSLHPHDYLPIKECFWATVENMHQILADYTDENDLLIVTENKHFGSNSKSGKKSLILSGNTSKGLIYFLTTCEEDENRHICQLLAANLATGFCQSAMKYSTLPSINKAKRIFKATYLEPFLVVAHSGGAFLWSVMEEFCCAVLPSTSSITSIAISRDFDNWGLLAVGSNDGRVNCYSLNGS